MRLKLIPILFIISISFLNAQDQYSIKKEIIGNAYNKGETNLVRFSVLDDDKIVYSLDFINEYDMPYPSAKLFSDGSMAVIRSFDASIEFYDKAGKYFDKRMLLGENNLEYERAVYTCVDADKLGIAINDSKPENSSLIILNNRNELVLSRSLSTNRISGIELNAQLKKTAVSFHRNSISTDSEETLIVDFSNRTLAILPFVFTKGSFNGNDLFTGNTNRYAFSVRLTPDGYDKEYYYEAEPGKLILDSFRQANDLLVAISRPPELLGGKWIHKNVVLLNVNSSGAQVISEKSMDFNAIEFQVRSNKLKMLMDNNLYDLN